MRHSEADHVLGGGALLLPLGATNQAHWRTRCHRSGAGRVSDTICLLLGELPGTLPWFSLYGKAGGG